MKQKLPDYNLSNNLYLRLLVQSINNFLPLGGSFLSRTSKACSVRLEQRGPIGPQSSSRSMLSTRIQLRVERYASSKYYTCATVSNIRVSSLSDYCHYTEIIPYKNLENLCLGTQRMFVLVSIKFLDHAKHFQNILLRTEHYYHKCQIK